MKSTFDFHFQKQAIPVSISPNGEGFAVQIESPFTLNRIEYRSFNGWMKTLPSGEVDFSYNAIHFSHKEYGKTPSYAARQTFLPVLRDEVLKHYNASKEDIDRAYQIETLSNDIERLQKNIGEMEHNLAKARAELAQKSIALNNIQDGMTA